MGFLKKFFPATNPTILEVVAKPKPKKPEILPPLMIKDSVSAPAQPALCTIKPDERVLAIENHAMAVGWTWNQLWQEGKRRDLQGLATILQKGQVITTVTRQYIQIERTSPTGKLEVQRFYNHNVEQPWLKGLLH